jgi:hypothetical protein
MCEPRRHIADRLGLAGMGPGGSGMGIVPAA